MKYPQIYLHKTHPKEAKYRIFRKYKSGKVIVDRIFHNPKPREFGVASLKREGIPVLYEMDSCLIPERFLIPMTVFAQVFTQEDSSLAQR